MGLQICEAPLSPPTPLSFARHSPPLLTPSPDPHKSALLSSFLRNNHLWDCRFVRPCSALQLPLNPPLYMWQEPLLIAQQVSHQARESILDLHRVRVLLVALPIRSQQRLRQPHRPAQERRRHTPLQARLDSSATRCAASRRPGQASRPQPQKVQQNWQV
jgi:hypothetical protein